MTTRSWTSTTSSLRKVHVAAVPEHPETLHYTGEGVFMVAGKIISRRSLFRPEIL
jgi:hypothetical protein